MGFVARNRRRLPAFTVVAGVLFNHVVLGQDAREPLESALVRIDNSPGLSQIVAINASGAAVGSRETTKPGIGLTSQAFYCQGGRTVPIPRPEGYSHVHAEAISDHADVVGYAGRAAVAPRLLAFVWNADTGRLEKLDCLEGDRACHAFDVSADGRIAVGYSTGPDRMVPCVWERGDDLIWHVTELPTIHLFNPFMLSSRVVISDDGQRIAACLTARIVPAAVPRYDSEVFQWRWQRDGSWQRQRRLPHAARLGDINNQGLLVGSIETAGGRRAFVSDCDDTFVQLGTLPGCVSAEATDVNNAGLVVGFGDDPSEPEGGPQAFRWQAGMLEPIRFPADVLYSAAMAVNDRGQIGGYLVSRRHESRWGKTLSFLHEWPGTGRGTTDHTDDTDRREGVSK